MNSQRRQRHVLFVPVKHQFCDGEAVALDLAKGKKKAKDSALAALAALASMMRVE